MKTIYTFTALFFWGMSLIANGQPPNWQWARSTGCFDSWGYGVSADASGNIYVIGSFDCPATAFGNDTLTNVGYLPYGGAFFIVKYDSAGNVIWARSAERGDAYGIIADARGNVYVTGTFGDTIIIGNDTLIGSNNEFFIVKYDSTGNVIWANSGGHGGHAIGYSVSVDSYDNVYVTGGFEDTIFVIGRDTLITTNEEYYQNESYDFFIVKYDSKGNVIWGKIADGNEYQNETSGGNGVSTDGNGNVYATGSYNGNINFGSGAFELPYTGYTNVFIVKYDSIGKVIWANGSIGDNSGGYGIICDAYGNVYAIGFFAGAFITFGNETLTNTLSNTSDAFFIVKYNSAGNVIWGKVAAGSVGGISIDPNGNIYVTGAFGDIITFGNDTLINAHPDDGADLFVVKYDSSGNVIWANSAAGGLQVQANLSGISTDLKGNVYVTGAFADSIAFDNIVLTYNNGSDQAYFLAKLGTPNSTGIAELNNPLGGITVYPNPSTGIVYFKGVKIGYTIEVYNMLGKTIYTTTVDRDNYSINLTGNAKGMYFYRIADAITIIQQGKIIVE